MRYVMWILLPVGALTVAFGLASWSIDLLDVTFVGLLIVVGLLAIVAGALFDIWRRSDLSTGSSLLWTVAIVVFPILGSLVYAFARPPAGQITYKGEQPT